MKSQKVDTFHGNEIPLMSLLICQLPNSFASTSLIAFLDAQLSSCHAGCWLPEEPAAPTGKWRNPGIRQPAHPAASQLASAWSRQTAWKPPLFLPNFLTGSCSICMSCLIIILGQKSIPSEIKN